MTPRIHALIAMLAAAPAGLAFAGTGADPAIVSWTGTSAGVAINETVGATAYYNAGVFGQGSYVANIEAGRVWNGHEILTGVSNSDVYVPRDSLGAFDNHATAVGAVIAGNIPGAASLPYYQAGIAPSTRLASGAIASVINGDGSFEVTYQSVFDTYSHYFTGSFDRDLPLGSGISLTLTAPTDVINSSWGYTDPSGADSLTTAIDALAAANSLTTAVFATGNNSVTVGGPASGYNAIAVGASGDGSGLDYTSVATFSNGGPLGVSYTSGGTTVDIPNARAGVTLVAPGQNIVAPYTTTDSTAYHDLSGTSFAAPAVAGGIALMKSASYLTGMGDEGRDTRVIKAALMASATQLPGWDNGQYVSDGVIVTTQAVDYHQGAGQLDLATALEVHTGAYLPGADGTADVGGAAGGVVDRRGWDFASLAAVGASNDYLIDTTLYATTYLDVSLSWFREYADPVFTDNAADPNLQDLSTADLRFANLDLEIWNADFTRLFATSRGLYDTVEFLHYELETSGIYNLRVTYAGQVFGDVAATSYGLAWSAIPEPTSLVLVVAAAGGLCLPRRRRQ